MNESHIAVNYIKALQDITLEKIIVLYLDEQDGVIFTTFHTWSTEGREIYPQQISSVAIKIKANKVVIIHDQPSGVIMPTKKDKQFATNILSSLRANGLTFKDYIINAGENSYYSMADNRSLTRES